MGKPNYQVRDSGKVTAIPVLVRTANNLILKCSRDLRNKA